MRIALLSDIHGNLAALEAVCADLTRYQPDFVINLGDSLSGPLLPLQTARFLMQQTNWLHLAGNHERQILLHPNQAQSAADAYAYKQLGNAELTWISQLQPTLAWSDQVFVCHASPRSDLEYLCETITPQGLRLSRHEEIQQRLDGVATSVKVIACGHSHLPRLLRLPNNCLIINPGSIGLPAYDDDFRYHHKAETGASDARYALLELVKQDWHASLHAVSYDYQSMAELAEHNQRPDWAYAIRTGYAVSSSTSNPA